MVVSGPSGVGKGTVVAALRERLPGVLLSVSVTTRPARPGEQDGHDYRFLSEAEFDELVATGGLLEWAVFAGHRYGTPAAPVLEALAAGRDIICEIDVQGARQLRQRVPDALLLFLEPPSLDVLAERLRQRGTEDETAIAERLDVALAELAEADTFDHVVTNDDVDAAATQIIRILEQLPA